jgi:hypothetical protein
VFKGALRSAAIIGYSRRPSFKTVKDMSRILPSVWLAALALALSNWAASAEPLGESILAADAPCIAKQWPNTAFKIACLNSVEGPVIQQQLPSALTAFQIFAQARITLAQDADKMHALGVEQAARYSSAYIEAFAVLKAHEPRIQDQSSALYKEWMGARAPEVCRPYLAMVEQVRCIDSILRPIWQRNAAETLRYYDDYQKQHLELARRFDASGALES